MSRPLLINIVRVSVAIGALWLGLGVSTLANAADTVQRVAMVSPSHHGAQVAARVGAEPAAKPSNAARELATAKSAKPAAGSRHDSDGSRFRYDSCGCSGS